ncbi:MAG: RtcB family protein [Pseudomonadota bacterium]
MTPDVARALDRLALTEDVVRLAVLPDVHLAKEVCVGVALASNARLFPDAVGGDIGCGMAAIRFHCDGAALTHRKTVARLLSRLYEEVPITKHRVGKAACPEGESLKGAILSHPTLEKRLARDGALQLGSLGRGNHFLEFQVDQDDALWAMVHSGSRAMGQAIRAHHLKTATRSSSGLMSISAESTEGEAYLNDVGWALDYAAANRAAMIAAVSGILFDELRVDPDADSFVSCHHNFVAREEIGGRLLWVHRKGVISARQDEPGLVPGSMGTSSFHVVGRGSEDSLCSSSHGAGRAMSRGEARRRISVRALEKQMAHVWFDQRMAARLVDEAPSAYKDISAVMRAQRDLTRIIRELRPVLTFKGG